MAEMWCNLGISAFKLARWECNLGISAFKWPRCGVISASRCSNWRGVECNLGISAFKWPRCGVISASRCSNWRGVECNLGISAFKWLRCGVISASRCSNWRGVECNLGISALNEPLYVMFWLYKSDNVASGMVCAIFFSCQCVVRDMLVVLTFYVSNNSCICDKLISSCCMKKNMPEVLP